MRLFISWSGESSRKAAEALSGLIPAVLQQVMVFMNHDSREAWSRWGDKVRDAITSAEFAIACITRENINEPWMAFELGVLTTKLGAGFFVPVLVDLHLSELTGPLARTQAATLTRSDIYRVLFSINSRSAAPLADHVLKKAFDHLWPTFERIVSPEAQPTLGESDLLTDKLDKIERALKDLSERINVVEGRSKSRD